MGGTRLTWDDILDDFDLRAGPLPGRDREAARSATLVQADDGAEPRPQPAIERSGGPGNDNIRGTEDDDTLRGLGGNDTLRGGAGDDALLGGTGDDQLSGEVGNDQLSGEADVDTLFGGDNNDVLHGGSENDTLFGDDGRDRLFGDAGVDRLVGGPGGDFYFVDDTDEVIDENPGVAGDPRDQVRSTVTFTLPDNVEDLTLLGAAAINGTGNGLNNVLNGNAARNVLSGLRGRDTLNGGEGDDVLRGGDAADDLFGGPGDDRLEGGPGNDIVMNGGPGIDTFFGGSGNDFLSYEGAPEEVVVDLARGMARADGGVERLSGIESVIGGEGNDRLVGDGNRNFLEGRGGNDTLIGALAGFGGGGGPVVGTPVTGDGTLVGGLGGAAGFGENALAPQDDSPSATVDLSSVFEDGLDFFSIGDPFTSVFINNNGNVTFNTAQSAFTPPVLTGNTGNPIMAPFFADVDTNPPEAGGPPGGTVYWDLDTARDVFTVTWSNVGYFRQHTDKTNSFQLQLYDRGAGDFDMVFRYGAIDWTTGDASGGSNGLGGTVARAGWNSGNGVNFFELPASGNQAQVLNLEAARGNTGVRGLWAFQVRNGVIEGDPDILRGDEGNDILVGGVGADSLEGGPGRDRFEYDDRNEGGDGIFDFELGRDVIDLASVLTGFTPGASSPAAFLRVEETPRPNLPDELGFRLSVDFDGGGDNFVAFVDVFGAGGDVTVDQLVGGGAIDLVP
jgi:Ca2+-binding RTX toxin-like protein